MKKLRQAAVAALAFLVQIFLAERASAGDPRATDAADLFVDLCVGNVLGLPSTLDRSGLGFNKMDETFASNLTGREPGTPVYAFSFKASGAMLLISQGPRGLCVERVGDANEADTQDAFRHAIQAAADRAGAKLEPGSTEVRDIQGAKVTYKSWTLRSDKAALILALTTSPRLVGMAQHVMTASPTR